MKCFQIYLTSNCFFYSCKSNKLCATTFKNKSSLTYYLHESGQYNKLHGHLIHEKSWTGHSGIKKIYRFHLYVEPKKQ